MIVSREFIFNVIDNLHLGIIVTNKRGDVIRYNKVLNEYFQIDTDQETPLNNKHRIEYIIDHSKLGEILRSSVTEVRIIKTQLEISIDYIEKSRKKNIKKLFRVDVYPLTDGKRFPEGTVAMLTDITPINEIDNTIRTRLLNLKTVINNTEYSIYSIDHDLNYIEFNNTYKKDFYRLFGIEIKIGDPALNTHLPEKILNDWKIFYTKTLKGHKIIEHYSFNDEPYLITLSPLTDNDKVTGITVFAENIKDEMKLRNDFSESQFKYKFAMDASNTGFWDWDMISNEIYYSSIWTSMLGYSKEEIEQSYYGWERLVHKEELPIAYEAIEKHIKGETVTYELEARLLCKNGEYKWVLATGRIIEEMPDGRPKRFIGIHVDIDHIKRTETDLKKRNEQLNEIAYITSHGVRKSLANILGLTKIIDIEKFTDPENREMINNLLNAADELNNETIKLNKAVKHLNKNLFKETAGGKRIVKEIMLVDDDPINNLITSKYIQKAGLNSKIFESPIKAMEYLKSNNTSKPDLILLDINMPEMDGFEFIRMMEQQQLDFEIIILTSSISMDDRNYASNYKSVIDFWVKPLNYSKIVEFNLEPMHI